MRKVRLRGTHEIHNGLIFKLLIEEFAEGSLGDDSLEVVPEV